MPLLLDASNQLLDIVVIWSSDKRCGVKMPLSELIPINTILSKFIAYANIAIRNCDCDINNRVRIINNAILSLIKGLRYSMEQLLTENIYSMSNKQQAIS
jgi:hypothetical protein